MKLAPIACVVALAACAATPKGELAYELRTTVYEMPSPLAKALTGLEYTRGGFPLAASVVERLQRAMNEHKDVTVYSRPTIRVREGSVAEIRNISETDYVQDWKVDAQGKPQAVHAKAPDGLALELRPHAREAALELGFRAELNRLQQPIREADVTLASGEKVKVQLPIVAKDTLTSKVTLAKGECLALLLPGADEQHSLLVTVQAKR